MPYIERDERFEINETVDSLVDAILAVNPTNPSDVPKGRLNYAITRLCHMILQEGDLSYGRISDVRAVLQDANDEYYWQIFRPYEDLKKAENGPVSSLDGPDLNKLCDAYPFGDDDS